MLAAYNGENGLVHLPNLRRLHIEEVGASQQTQMPPGGNFVQQNVDELSRCTR